MIGAPEILLILIAFAVLWLFGSGKLKEWAKGIARAKGEFEKEKRKIDLEIKGLEKGKKKSE